MAGFKALLVVFLVAFAKTKIINGLPIDAKENTSDDSDYDNYYGEGKSVSDKEGTGTNEYDDSTLQAMSMKTLYDDSVVENQSYEDEENVTEAGDSRGVIKRRRTQRQRVSTTGGTIRGFSITTSSGKKVNIDSPDFFHVIGVQTSNGHLVIYRHLFIGSNKMFWIKKPGDIVMVEGNKCTRAIYKRGRRVSIGTLSQWECAEVQEEIENRHVPQ